MTLSTRAGRHLDLEEDLNPPHSGLAGQKLFEAKSGATGSNPRAEQQRGNGVPFNPLQRNTARGDTMVVLGTKEQAEKLNAIVTGAGTERRPARLPGAPHANVRNEQFLPPPRKPAFLTPQTDTQRVPGQVCAGDSFLPPRVTSSPSRVRRKHFCPSICIIRI
jgi:hypothetical protein